MSRAGLGAGRPRAGDSSLGPAPGVRSALCFASHPMPMKTGEAHEGAGAAASAGRRQQGTRRPGGWAARTCAHQSAYDGGPGAAGEQQLPPLEMRADRRGRIQAAKHRRASVKRQEKDGTRGRQAGCPGRDAGSKRRRAAARPPPGNPKLLAEGRAADDRRRTMTFSLPPGDRGQPATTGHRAAWASRAMASRSRGRTHDLCRC